MLQLRHTVFVVLILLAHSKADGGYGLKEILQDILGTTNYYDIMECKSKLTIPSSSGECTCSEAVTLGHGYIQDAVNNEAGLNALIKLCTNAFPYDFCNSITHVFLDTASYILKSNNTIVNTPADICGIIFGHCGCAMEHPPTWTIDVDLGTKPQAHTSNGNTSKEKPLTVVQIPDIHLDPTYTPYGNAVCNVPMCCRSNQGKPQTPNATAGYWGDYRNCDLSWWAFKDALDQIKKTHKEIDYIYFTGDIVDHAIWDTSIEKNTKIIKNVLTAIKSIFPNIPVYPLLGNHEPSPINAYAPDYITDKKVSTSWLFELVAKEWSAWLPAETKETILRGGFYTVLVRPGFRIIGLNNNVCYNLNLWLLYDTNDTYGQLKWLAETLLKAEKDGEKVHILTHVPPGDRTCIQRWSHEYRKLIDRFEATVTGQFHGHTHADELEIFYSIKEPSKPINVAYNGGSLTQFFNLNSNYKVYSVDPATYEIVDAETWIYNLAKANLHGNSSAPQWYKLYSYREEYGMESLSPAEFNKLAHRMASDKKLLQKYARHFMKDAEPSLNCDDQCLKDKLCLLATADSGDLTQCNELVHTFQNGK